MDATHVQMLLASAPHCGSAHQVLLAAVYQLSASVSIHAAI
jgi:hypothetical protein